MNYRFIIMILSSVFSQGLVAQLHGWGSLDGMYAFEIHLQESDDSFMEGSIQFEGEEMKSHLIATTRGDTLRCQEIDESLNAVSTFMMIKSEDVYSGQWYDETAGILMPVRWVEGNTCDHQTLSAYRYFDREDIQEQVLFEIPLSPTVSTGKILNRTLSEMYPYSVSESFGLLSYYSPKGKVDALPTTPEVVECIELIAHRQTHKNYSVEALIPNFHSQFVDSLYRAFERWKKNIHVATLTDKGKHRFPNRNYAICDLDYWTTDLIAGSFEYVGPRGEGEGFTFIYDRKNNQFISLLDLIRSGNKEYINRLMKNNSIGLSFNYFGIISKGKFDAVYQRDNKLINWEDLPFRMKRKIRIR